MSSSEPRLTPQTLEVLAAIISAPCEAVSGADITRGTNIQSGTLYPILIRLEQAGWLTSFWESDEPKALGRPRKRLYQITALGARKARAAARSMTATAARLAWT